MINQFNKYPLLSHNTFGIEAIAEQFVEFSSVDELQSVLDKGFNGRSLVIGGGYRISGSGSIQFVAL